MDTGERIAQLRKPRMTQEALAKKLGVNVRSISRWETNERSVPSDKLADLADVLGTSTDYLLCKTDEPRPVSPAARPPKKPGTEDFNPTGLQEKLLEFLAAIHDRGKTSPDFLDLIRQVNALSEDEKQLLLLWRSLSPEKQETALRLLKAL